jgi:WD40 repeat protein
VAFSPDGTQIATASNDNTARLWDSATGHELARLTHDDAVGDVAFSPDGTQIATANRGRRMIEIQQWSFLATLFGNSARAEHYGYATVWERRLADRRQSGQL